MFSKSFLTKYYFLQTLTRATPIILCSLATCMSWRAGHINIGVEGQMVVGGFVGAISAIYIPGPPILIMILAIIMAMIAGGLFAGISAVLEYKFGVSLIISTLMLNYVASYVTSFFVSGSLKAVSADGVALQTEMVPEGMRIWNLIPKTTFNFSFVIAVIITILFVFYTKYTVFGYESRMTGLNKECAKFGGIKPVKIILLSMFLSGAIAGIAGIGEVFGYKGRFIEGMLTSSSFAWTGLMAALMAGLNPIGSFFTSIFLAGLQVGGQSIQRSAGVPLEIATIIQSSITLFISVKIAFNFFKGKKIKEIKKDVKAYES